MYAQLSIAALTAMFGLCPTSGPTIIEVSLSLDDVDASEGRSNNWAVAGLPVRRGSLIDTDKACSTTMQRRIQEAWPASPTTPEAACARTGYRLPPPAEPVQSIPLAAFDRWLSELLRASRKFRLDAWTLQTDFT